MSPGPGRCAICGAMVDAEDLFCANCGTEIPAKDRDRPSRLAIKARNFRCRGCGASMNYDASAQNLKCPFCGSVHLEEDRGGGIFQPECVVSFAIDRGDAEARLRSYLGSSVWHPGDLRAEALVTELRPVFVPCWIFEATVRTHWTADSDRTPPGARADWYPIAGRSEGRYEGVWVAASAGIPRAELDAIWPFDASAAVGPDQVDLENVTVEQFTVSRRHARPLAQGALESMEARSVAREAGGQVRNVHVNVLMDGSTSKAALAPVYVMAYRYRSRVYRFVLNGQTGRSFGSAPVSAVRIGAAVAALIVALILILLLVAR